MNYELHELNFIKDDYDNFITDCFDAKKRFDAIFPEQSSTWTFGKYNIFCHPNNILGLFLISKITKNNM